MSSILGDCADGIFWSDSRANYLGGVVVDHMVWSEVYLLLEGLEVCCDVSTGSKDVVMRGLRML